MADAVPADPPSRPYPDVDPLPRFPALEQAVIERWRAEDTFGESVRRRRGAPELTFYDGPPFANGVPHYGHLLTGFVKDAVPRYRTMRGQHVTRRFGWDCHGLPVEMEAEKALGVTGRMAIEDYGVGRFNERCRDIVGTTADTWDAYVSRQARWVTMHDAYRTMDLDYMESVMWAVKSLHDKGLLYEGQRVLPYCWECETPLSNFETRMDDAYRDRQDPAVTVAFTLEPAAEGDPPEQLLVWTTTPWTLPSNLAIAVRPAIEYAVYARADGSRWILGGATVGAYATELEGAERVATISGAELVGRRYRPLFDYFAGTDGAHVVLGADFVTTDDGTGVVHLAPGFGEDDKAACDAAGIPTITPVDEHARFTAEVPDFAGLQVFDANTPIIRELRARDALVRHDSYNHAYPHCWRTDTPLIYKAVSSWFVAVTAIRDRMVELNQEITWVPAHVRDGSFGKWLEGARDWSISRNRFWGSPIPVWKSDDPAHPRVDVYGSLDELERDFGVRPTDLHRPTIDELTRPNPDDPTGRSTMRRIPDVLDCWFESGAMPFARVHHPFESDDPTPRGFPADFICEYIGQTRGWFYTMHVLSTALFDGPAFATCVVHGVLLGDDGQKLSKRLSNYPDPVEFFDAVGADAMRWSLLSSAVLRGGDLVVDTRPMQEAVRQVLLPIWNAWSFLSLYANAGGVRGQTVTRPADQEGLDAYVLAHTRVLVVDVTARMDAYDLSGACGAIRSFLDALNNWYIRRSRSRFWAGDPDAISTLHTVLEVLCRLSAPVLPLLTDTIWPALTGGASVHLADWPDPDELWDDPDFVTTMDQVRDVCSAAASVRKERGLRNRLPLTTLTVASPGVRSLGAFRALIAEEVNVKEVLLTSDVAGVADTRLSVLAKVLGPRVGADVQTILKAVKAGDWSRDGDGRVVVAGRTLLDDEYELRLVPRDGTAAASLPADRGLVVLDTVVTPDLEAEGIARDLIRAVNEARRTDGLHVSDRIHLVIDPGHHADVAAAVKAHRDLIAGEVLATELIVDTDDRHRPPGAHRVVLSDGRAVHVGLTRRT
jgi:isoleucyl-tRNA synthetase